VFVCYLYQRFVYPVDRSRPMAVEDGGAAAADFEHEKLS
jgi:hypothetical protein